MNGATAVNVSVSLPRTETRAFIAAWRTADAGDSAPTSSATFWAGGDVVLAVGDRFVVAGQHLQREAVHALPRPFSSVWL